MGTRQMEFVPPVQGLDRHWAFRKQPIESSPDALNVRGYGVEGGRKRIGQRPGMTGWHSGTGIIEASCSTPLFFGTGLDDLTAGGAYTGAEETEYLIEIDSAGYPGDTFRWSKDNGTTWEAEKVAITGAAQTLDQGVTVTFGAIRGHTGPVGKPTFTGSGTDDVSLSTSSTQIKPNFELYVKVHTDTAYFRYSYDVALPVWSSPQLITPGVAQSFVLGFGTFQVTFATGVGLVAGDIWAGRMVASDRWAFTASGVPIRLLASVTTAKEPGTYTGTDEDDFNRADTVIKAEGLGDGWITPSWQMYDVDEGETDPTIKAWASPLRVKDRYARNRSGERGVAVRTTFGQPELSDSIPYHVKFNIGPKASAEDPEIVSDEQGGGGGTLIQEYHVFLQLNDLDPNMGNEGIDVTFQVSKIDGKYYLSGDVEGRYGVDSTKTTDFGDFANVLLVSRGAWSATAVYQPFQTVTYDGKTYQCIKTTQSSAPVPGSGSAKDYWVESLSVPLSESLNSLDLRMTGNELRINVTVNGRRIQVFGDVDCAMTPALQGRTVGIGMKKDNWGLDNWLVTGLLLQGAPATRKTTLVAGANGHLYYESEPGVMTLVTGDAAVISTDYPIMAEELNGKLYIADYAEPRMTADAGEITISGAGHDTLAFTTVTAWSGATAYVVGDIARLTGVDYRCILAHTNHTPPNTTYWLPYWTNQGINKDTDVVVLVGDSAPPDDPTSGTYLITAIAEAGLTIGSTVNNGTCAIRIEKAPLVLDPATDPPTVSIWTATSGYGHVPTGCQLMCRYKGALVLARSATDVSNWQMCRMNDALDWDYGETDIQAAAYYAGGTVGKPGDAITALMPWKDDYLLFGCANSLYVMRGHPKDNGTLDAISYAAGVLTGSSWCAGPTGAAYWLGPGGFMAMHSIQGDMNPKNLSQNVIPADLAGINPENFLAYLSYDVERFGVWITITSKASGSSRSWFWDERTGAFWPDRYPSDKDPTIAYNYLADSNDRTGLVFGCRDGRLRVFSDITKDDDGDAIDCYVVFAPQLLGKADGQDGILTCLRADLSLNTDRVDWQLRVSDTFEGAVSATAKYSGTWTGGGRKNPVYRRVRGKAICLRLSNSTAGKTWESEQIIGTVLDGGMTRR